MKIKGYKNHACIDPHLINEILVRVDSMSAIAASACCLLGIDNLFRNFNKSQNDISIKVENLGLAQFSRLLRMSRSSVDSQKTHRDRSRKACLLRYRSGIEYGRSGRG